MVTRDYPLFVSLATAIAAGVMVCGFADDDQPDWGFVEITQQRTGIVVDLPYATKKNFFKTQLYSLNRCFLRRVVAKRLVAVQGNLEKQGLGLKIWDGYRPLSVQKAMWRIKPDPTYVANPSNGSRHNRGAAVDVTLVDADGSELKMPTTYDEFSPRARANDLKLSRVASKNRTILQEAMTANGFTIMPSEWWHFDAAGWRGYGIVDISIEELAKQSDI